MVARTPQFKTPFQVVGGGKLEHGASSASPAGTGDLQWTHEPAGVPIGAVVLAASQSNSDPISEVTYGGQPMTEAEGSPVLHKEGAEDGTLCAFFLAKPPSGNQEVVVKSATVASRRAVCHTIGGKGEVALADVAILDSAGVANPTVELTNEYGRALTYGVLFSGQNEVTGISAGAGMVEVLEHDFGVQSASWLRSSDVVAKGETSVGWVAASEEAGIIAVAVGLTPVPALVLEVEQDSIEEIESCVEAVLRTIAGTRVLDAPDFGIPDETFVQQTPNSSAELYIAAIEAQEPRARVLGEARLEELATKHVTIEAEA